MPPRFNDIPYRHSFGQAVLETDITDSHVLVKRYSSCMHCQRIALPAVKPLDISAVTTYDSTLGI
jgi:hypothetical protein